MKVRLQHYSKDIDRTASMKAPRRVEDIFAWLKQARKSIPEIPEVSPTTLWRIQDKGATVEKVAFHLVRTTPNLSLEYDECFVTIDRLASSLGA